MTTTAIISTTVAARIEAAESKAVDYDAPIFDYDGVIVITPAVFVGWVWEHLDGLHFCEIAHPETLALVEGRIKHNAVLDALEKLSPDLFADAVRRWNPLR